MKIKNKKIAIILIGTNGYFLLACRFVNRFNKFYKGQNNITFHMFTDKDPSNYLPDIKNFIYYKTFHKTWREAVNDKFNCIKKIKTNEEYVYFFDADTNIQKEFDDWFIGEHVVGKHFGYNESVSDEMPFDRHKHSSCFIPMGTKNLNYYYGAFWGGKKNLVFNYCSEIKKLQEINKTINHEPVWNDESYTNYYFNFILKPNKIIETKDFQFVTSCKGGMHKIRINVDVDLTTQEKIFRENKDKVLNILNNSVIIEK